MAVPGQRIRVGRLSIEITHPAKVLFPADGITKWDLVDYYRRIAAWMLPHLRERPLAMERYPDGLGQASFFHKAVPSYYPDWIERVTVKKEGGTITQAVCSDAATLVYLANQACITPHVWLSRVTRLNHPDQMVFDLDPPGENFQPESFASVLATARSFGELLDELELPVYVKTTGSRGLHLAVPLDSEEEFDSVRAFARQLARIVVSRDPEQRTLEQRKDKRFGRVFLDINRNAYAQTIAPAYAVRARPGAPVSMPLDWSDLDSKNLRPDGVTIRTVFDRLEKRGNPWRDFRRRAASLNRARRKLEKLNAPR
jgi:bifunctional non-homologous end joining protein LigD